MTDSQLVSGCRRQEGPSQEALYRRFGPATLGICRRYASDHMEAEDLHQQGWMRAFDKIHLYNDAGSLEGWLKQLFVRVCLNAYQKKRRRLQWMEQRPDELLPDAPAETTQGDFLAQERLVAAISALPEGARLVFNLFAIEGYNHTEIAQELGITEGNSRQQLLRARTALANKIRPTPPTSGLSGSPAKMSILAYIMLIIQYPLTIIN